MPDAGYSRNASCALNQISTFSSQKSKSTNKRYRKPKGQSIKNNSEPVHWRQDTEQRQTKQTKTHHSKHKRRATRTRIGNHFFILVRHRRRVTDKQNKQKHNTVSLKHEQHGLVKGNHFLLLIRHPSPIYSYSQVMKISTTYTGET